MESPDTTPLGLWLLRKLNSLYDPETGRPVTLRHASIEAGFKDPASIWRYIYERKNPNADSCDRLAAYFKVNPAYVRYLAGHWAPHYPGEPEPTEAIPAPPPPPLELDPARRALYARADEILRTNFPDMYSNAEWVLDNAPPEQQRFLFALIDTLLRQFREGKFPAGPPPE